MGARVVRYQNLRAAADLTATTVYDTPAVPCFGAKHVIFVFKATNANTPAACTLQVSGASTAGWLTTSGQRLGVIGAASGNSLANGIAMQIAAMMPQWVTREDVPAEVVAKERHVAELTAKEEGKPEAIIGRVVEGRLNGFFKEACLVEQASVSDDKATVGQLLQRNGVEVKRFVRFATGG